VSSKYFENPFRLEDPDDEQKRKTYIYAYIEGENERSISFSEQMGLQKARAFKTLVFSRFRSTKHKGCRLLKEEEIPEIKNKLSDYYSAYTMFTLENIAFEKDYWVYEREGQIVAGVKVHRGSWELADIKGFTGFLLKRLLPSLPFFRSFVQPGDFRFNALEGLFHTEGEESALNPLLSQIASIHKTPLFLIWADPESGMYRRLKEKVRPGLAGRLFHPVAGEVRVRFIGFDDREKDAFLKKPVYLSSFDMI
jgi:hypothetical protein